MQIRNGLFCPLEELPGAGVLKPRGERHHFCRVGISRGAVILGKERSLLRLCGEHIVKHGEPRIARRLLIKLRYLLPALHGENAVIKLLPAGYYPEECRLPGSVSSDKAEPLALLNRKLGMIKKGRGAE